MMSTKSVIWRKLRSKKDPLQERERELEARLAEVRQRIASLDATLKSESTEGLKIYSQRQRSLAEVPEFEKLDHQRLRQSAVEADEIDLEDVGRRFNLDEGRKSWWVKGIEWFRPTPALSPLDTKLVSYLAAGSFQGLRPLRYEKRMARKRFFILTGFLLFVLWGILSALLNH